MKFSIIKATAEPNFTNLPTGEENISGENKFEIKKSLSFKVYSFRSEKLFKVFFRKRHTIFMQFKNELRTRHYALF